MTDERFENVSDEAKAKVIACKTPEEMLEVAKSEGYELSLDELEAASGGKDWGDSNCQNDDKPC